MPSGVENMAIEKVQAVEVDSKVLLSELPAALDFYQDSCAPCHVLEPRLERVAEEYEGQVAVYRVDIERDMSVAERFEVMSIPTVIVFRDGEDIERLDGLVKEPDLRAAFERAVAK